ncbi:hypothetical protein EIP86_005693 [Pleurotus ostreatoroseus]|nr:hypothetical protein EIP86_005693 [Pleurotus ostreatoroseus]
MSNGDKDGARPGTPASDRSSITKKSRIQNEQTDVPGLNCEKQGQLDQPYHTDAKGGEGESAVPEDRLDHAQEDEIENAEDDWAHDTRNPRTWSFWMKWRMIAIVSSYTFVTPLASSMVAPALPALAAHYEITSGFFGSAPIACGGGSVSDLFSEKDRASAMAVYSLGPLIGPAVGPIAGGFIAETIGFKYIFIVISAVSGVAAAFGIPFLRETYAPVIRLRIAKNAADPEKSAQMHPHLVQNHGGKLHLMWINLSRPFILLTRSLVCFVLSLYMAL